MTASVHRWRVVAVSMALTALAFIQDPGRLVNDTKADLVIDPGAFLGRALQLWDPNGSFGQVQNQAYGYLFPMGPFFWFGDVLQVPGWVVQRAWWAVILVVAFLGIVKLCAVLEIGSSTARIIGGIAYALSPRMLTVIGPASIEVWPSAVAPWVLIPLVIGLRRGDPRRYALFAALAVAAIGGVNAVATAAVLPLGVLLILLAEPGPRRRALMLWWPLATIAATAWWTIPLVLLGKYSPPFLDYIESASTTTFAANPFDALRGTTYWLSYLDPTQEAGFQLIAVGVVVLNSVAVVVLGVWGLARTDQPARAWLLACLVTGLVLVTLGHVGTGGWGAAGWQSLLDGALSPLRNTHKFDVVIRLPLILGLVHLLTVLTRTGAQSRRKVGAVALSIVALVGASAPAWTADLPRTGSFESVPEYWEDAVDWLSVRAENQNTLMLPGSAFGDYLWGRPRDEVMQALATTPWSVRNGVPLTPPGAIRSLDAFEDAFASGQGSRALADHLTRSGIRYLLIRSDVFADGITDTELVYSTLSSTPGVRSVASFGPEIGSEPSLESNGQTAFVNGGLQSRHPVIEIFEVEAADAGQARTSELSSMPVLFGSPAGAMVQDGLFAASSDFLLAHDVPAGITPDRVVLTDTDRRQEVAFGRVPNGRSATLTREESYRIDRPVHDYVAPGQTEQQTVATLLGATSLTASSSVSDVTQADIDPAGSPWAAFDNDPSTAWAAGDLDGWIEIDYGREVSLDGATIRLPSGSGLRELEVRTDDGRDVVAAVGGATVSLAGEVMTRRLRVSLPDPSLTALSISSISVPDAPVARPLVLPVVPRAWGNPTDIVLTAAPGPATCRNVVDVTRCVAGLDGRGEDGSTIDRIVTLEGPAVFAGGMSVLPVQSQALSDQLSGDVGVRVSSNSSTDPTAGPLAMVDGELATGWIAALSDRTPTLTLDLGEKTELDALQLRTDASLAASAPGRVSLTFDDGSQQQRNVDVQGRVSFDAVTTQTVTIEIDRAYVRSTLAFDGSGGGLPVGISELSLPGTSVDPSDGASTVADLGCGSGPTMQVGDQTFESAVLASRRAVVDGVDLPTRICRGQDVSLVAGGNRVTVSASDAFRPTSLRLAQGGGNLDDITGSSVERTGDTSLTTTVPEGGAQVTTVAQTVNPGWSVNGATPVTVNGWMQGWTTGGGEITAEFAPAGWYRGGLVLGALLVLATGIMAWRLPNRPTHGHGRTRSGLRAAVAVGGIVAAAGMMAGFIGLVALGLGVVMARLLGASRSAPVAASVIALAGAGYVLHPWNSPNGWAGAEDWPQWLVVLAVGVAVSAGVRPRSLSRMAGRSTAR